MNFGVKSLSIIVTTAVLAFGAPAYAQSFQDSIVMQLEEQGYTDIVVSRTFLGRLRVVAQNKTHERELVFNPTTGELLRDFWRVIDAEKQSNVTIIPRISIIDEIESDDDHSGYGSNDNREYDGDKEDDRDEKDDDD